MGRPSDYSPELASLICERIASGESLRGICRGDDMPAASTVFRWLTEKPAFQEQYVRAREAQADNLFDEILEIADDGRNDWMERAGEDGQTGDSVLNAEHIQRSKLRVDARKWYLSKLAPKKYGDKIEHEHTGNVTIKASSLDEKL